MKKELDKLKFGFSNIIIFREILKTKVIKKLIKFLNSDPQDNIKIVDLYSKNKTLKNKIKNIKN